MSIHLIQNKVCPGLRNHQIWTHFSGPLRRSRERTPRGVACWPLDAHTILRTHFSNHAASFPPIVCHQCLTWIPAPHTTNEGHSLSPTRAAHPTPTSPPQGVAARPSSQVLEFVSEPSGMHHYANDVPTEGAHGQIAISRPHVGLLLFLQTAHSATAGN